LDVEIDTPRAHVAADVATSQMMPAAEAHDPTPKVEHDDASVAFQGQVDALRAAEANQQQRMAQGTPALPPTRALRLQHWREQGYSEAEADYFNALSENPHRTNAAVTAAREMGIDPNDVNFHTEVQKNFHRLTAAEAEAQAAPEPDPAEPVRRARGGAVDDEPSELGRWRPGPISLAMTERSIPGSYNANGERPGRVVLTPAQVEAAKIAGVSLKDYAEQVLRLRAEKAEGNYGGSP
jgi:hypothetical protein